jgi:DNA replication licensing factor MCM5
MRENDRVAIHEAMEQQTISIAKAGITTMLNCRNSVLAAANPIHGRYDDLRDVGDNINLMSTILSRFDCIFIVRDVREQERDRDIARHVLGVHITSSLAQTTNAIQPDIPAATMKKFVSYCRERCAPRLNEEAAALLSGQYVHIRNQVRENLANKPGEAQVVPITIRQLEAITRIAESLAKMRLAAEATVSDVEEALRLFKVSTLAASQSSPVILSAISGSNGAGVPREVQLAEEFLKRRIGIRVTVSTKKIIEEAQIQGYSNDVIRTGIRAMVMRNEMQELNQGKILRRIR